jgi:hypothetical protein
MRYLIIKIAAGVFLGIMAAALVYKAVDILEQYKHNRAITEQRAAEAAARKIRIEKAAKQLMFMTSEKVVVLCGSPIQFVEGIRPEWGGMVISLDYLGSDGHKVRLVFLGEGDNTFMEMERLRERYESKTPEIYEYQGRERRTDPVSEIEELPCLAGL